MRKQLDYLEKSIFKNLGFGVVDFYMVAQKELQKNVSKKNKNSSVVTKKKGLYTPKNKKKVLLLASVHEKKCKHSVLYKKQMKLRSQSKNFCKPSCNNCEKITCIFCVKYKYVNELLYDVNGPYYSKADILQKLLKFEFEKF